jgi:hypothetical protein
MKTSKFILFVTLALIGFTSKAQTVLNGRIESISYAKVDSVIELSMIYLFGEPRTPSQTSFYNKDLWIGDWHREKLQELDIYEKKSTFIGIESEVKTNGKTIVFDANETAIATDFALKGTDNISITKDKVFVEKDNRLYQIPIKFTGDNTVNSENFSTIDKTKLSNYVIESFKFSGSTPSNIEIKASNKDYDLFIFKSSFIPEDISIKRINMRTTQIFKMDRNVYYVFND